MDELESQIAKIQLENSKSTQAYVSTLIEKAEGSDVEIYMVAELPLLNPAAFESCEKICLAIASNLKRAFKKPFNDNSFETAISQINEELGKLTSFGQTYWIDKLNCIIGVKHNGLFSISTCGKVEAFLMRGNELTDISCSTQKPHPLKTFETFATGKIKIGDLLILSTTQLFNYVSLDRVKSILNSGNFLTATQTIIHLLKENADPGVAFATVFNLQVPKGSTPSEEIDLENYVIKKTPLALSLFTKSKKFVKAIFALDKTKRAPKIDLPKISLSQKIKNFGGNTKNAFFRSKNVYSKIKNTFSVGKKKLDIQHFQSFTPQKKFFFIAVVFLLVALVANLAITSKIKSTQKQQQQFTNAITESQKLIDNAQSSLLYKDELKAKEFLIKAQSALPDFQKLNQNNTNLYAQTFSKLQKATQDLEKTAQAHVIAISTLGESQNLIKLPGYLATQVNGQVIISYNLKTEKLEDGQIKLPDGVLNSVETSANESIIYKDGVLQVVNLNGTAGPQFTQNVPGKNDVAGLAKYSSNNRVYLVDKKLKKIFSFLIDKNNISKPVLAVSSQAQDLPKALDLTIDGNIYVFFDGGITKYHAGNPAEFNTPALISSIGNKGKIYTQSDLKYLYLLDSSNNRILIMTKAGSLVKTLVNPEFTNLSDFMVDEKNNVIFVLNNGSLLKVEIP